MLQKKYFRRSISLLMLGLLLSSFLLSFIPSRASAQISQGRQNGQNNNTGQQGENNADASFSEVKVIDRTKIKLGGLFVNDTAFNNIDDDVRNLYGNNKDQFMAGMNQLFAKEFTDRNIWDDNENYTLEVSTNGENCTSEITDIEPYRNTAKVILRFSYAVSGSGPNSQAKCREMLTTNSTLSDSGNLLLALRRVDAGKVEPLQFAQPITGGFVNSVENQQEFQQEGQECRNFVRITVPGSVSTFLKHRSTKVKNTTGACREAPWEGEQSWINDTALGITDPQNYQIPAGQGSSQTGADRDPAELKAAPPSCEASAFPLSWVMCPIINNLAQLTDSVYTELIQPMLKTDTINTNPIDSNGNPNPVFEVWSQFRIYANILLVIALLVIVFGQAIGGGVVDAYTAKKVLPRVLMAAILINLSIYIVAVAIDVTNIIGGGIRAIIEYPFRDVGAYKVTVDGVAGTALGFGSVFATIGTLWIGLAAPQLLLLFVLLPAFLAMIGVFITLILRKALIYFLIFVSPIAFAAFVLPNTEKAFKMWWNYLYKALLVYVVIEAIFAMSGVFAAILNMDTDTNGIVGGLMTVAALVILFMPIFLIPFAFKLTGGALGSLYGTIAGLNKRAAEGIKGNPNDPNALRNKFKRNAMENLTRSQNRVIQAGTGDASRWKRLKMRGMKAVGGNVNARMARLIKEAGEREEMESATGRDEQRFNSVYSTVAAGKAAPEGVKGLDGKTDVSGSVSDKLRYFDSQGKEINATEAKTDAARHGRGSEARSNLAYTLRKAKTDAHVAAYRRAFAETAARNGWDQDEIDVAHQAATYGHKERFGSEYYSEPKLVTNPDGSKKIEWSDVRGNTEAGIRAQNKMWNEIHKVRKGFELSSLSDQDLRSMNDRRNKIQEHWDNGESDNVSEEDAKFYAETNEVLDNMSQKTYASTAGLTPDGEPEHSVMGPSAASAGVIKALMNNRRYELRQSRESDGTFSVNGRDIYRAREADGSKAYAQTHVASTKVTGDADRSMVPESIDI